VEQEEMSDQEHVEPDPPPAEELANRLFAIAMAGILGFIAVVFIFII
jgi:hypothetical protein